MASETYEFSRQSFKWIKSESGTTYLCPVEAIRGRSRLSEDELSTVCVDESAIFTGTVNLKGGAFEVCGAAIPSSVDFETEHDAALAAYHAERLDEAKHRQLIQQYIDRLGGTPHA